MQLLNSLLNLKTNTKKFIENNKPVNKQQQITELLRANLELRHKVEQLQVNLRALQDQIRQFEFQLHGGK